MCNCALYPVMKAFGVAKGFLAAVLLILGAVLIWSEPKVINCNKFMSVCPKQFLVMQNAAHEVISYPKSAEINSYCACMNQCMNYFDIYKEDKQSLEETNCYEKAWAAGASQTQVSSTRRLSAIVQPVIDAEHWAPISRRLMTFMPNDQGLGGVAKASSCSSCAEIKDQLKQTFIFLGAMAVACACILGITTTCEVKALMMQSATFFNVTLLLDLVAFGILVTLSFISFAALIMSMRACQPDKWESEMKIGSQVQSGGNNEQSAAFLNFFVSVLEPLFSDVCMQKSKFTIFWMVSVVSAFCEFMGLLLICSIGCGLSADDEDEDGANAQDVDKLQNFMPHKIVTGAVPKDYADVDEIE